MGCIPYQREFTKCDSITVYGCWASSTCCLIMFIMMGTMLALLLHFRVIHLYHNNVHTESGQASRRSDGDLERKKKAPCIAATTEPSSLCGGGGKALKEINSTTVARTTSTVSKVQRRYKGITRMQTPRAPPLKATSRKTNVSKRTDSRRGRPPTRFNIKQFTRDVRDSYRPPHFYIPTTTMISKTDEDTKTLQSKSTIKLYPRKAFNNNPSTVDPFTLDLVEAAKQHIRVYE